MSNGGSPLRWKCNLEVAKASMLSGKGCLEGESALLNGSRNHVQGVMRPPPSESPSRSSPKDDCGRSNIYLRDERGPGEL